MPNLLEDEKPRIHPDFPTGLGPGSIGGAQPKLLLSRRANGMYGSPQRSPEELLHRYTIADDLVDQLVSYFQRKKRENPEWGDEKNLERIRLALIKKAVEGKWKFTVEEQGWIMDRLRERRHNAPAGDAQ